MAYAIASNDTELDYEFSQFHFTNNSFSVNITNTNFPNQNAYMPPGGLSPFVLRLQVILGYLKIYYVPCLVGFGMLGNIVSCIILWKSKLAALSCSHYLSAVLVADLLFLVNLFFLWLVDIGADLYRLGAWCHLTTFLSHASSFLSLWYTTCLALDRLLYLRYGSLQRHCCSVLKAKVLILAFAMIAIAVFLNMSLTFGVVYMGTTAICTPLTRFYHALHTLSQIDVFLNCVIPYIFILCVFFMGVAKVYHKQKNNRLGPNRRIPRRIHYYGSDHEKGQQTGPVCFIGYYLGLTLPSQSFRLFMTIKEMSGTMGMVNLEMVLLQKVLQYLHYTRFSLNILILLLCYNGFRASTGACLKSAARAVCGLFEVQQRERKYCDIEDTSGCTSEPGQDDAITRLCDDTIIQEGAV